MRTRTLTMAGESVQLTRSPRVNKPAWTSLSALESTLFPTQMKEEDVGWADRGPDAEMTAEHQASLTTTSTGTATQVTCAAFITPKHSMPYGHDKKQQKHKRTHRKKLRTQSQKFDDTSKTFFWNATHWLKILHYYCDRYGFTKQAI